MFSSTGARSDHLEPAFPYWRLSLLSKQVKGSGQVRLLRKSLRFLFGKGLTLGMQKSAIGIEPIRSIKGRQLFKT